MHENKREEIYREIREWFIEFTKQYDNNHPTLGSKFKHKKVHTEHVCELMKECTKREGFSEEDALIALISARLHDTSRFEQTLHFHTYDDTKSFDHGDRAVEVLQEQKVLTRLSPVAQHFVYTAVQYHNKKDTNIPTSLSERELFFLNILRDVDKLDNIKEEVDDRAPKYKAEIDNLVKKGVSVNEQSLSSFLRCECVDYVHTKTALDRIFLVASWAFDLNTKTAFQICKEHDWFNTLLDFLPQNEVYVKQAKLLVAKHIEEKLQ